MFSFSSRRYASNRVSFRRVFVLRNCGALRQIVGRTPCSDFGEEGGVSGDPSGIGVGYREKGGEAGGRPSISTRTASCVLLYNISFQQDPKDTPYYAEFV